MTMTGKCCCGLCSLSTGTSVALSLCAVQATLGLLWNTELLFLLNKSSGFTPLDMLINVHTIEDNDVYQVIHGLTLAAIGLNAFWLIFTIAAARGNTNLSHGPLVLWDVFMYIIILFDLGTTIFFVIKLQEFGDFKGALIVNSKPTKTLTFLTLFLAFSKGGVLMLLNTFLAHVVQKRGKEINHDHSVLALYLLSHLSRCPAGDITQQPPTRALYTEETPVYVLPTRHDPRSDSDGSQWSLSYEAIQNMNHEPPPKYVPPSGNRTTSPLAFARALSRGISSNSIIHTASPDPDSDTTPILP